MTAPSPLTLLVGMVPQQPDAVILHAAALAKLLGARLVCATVDISRYTVDEHPDGSVQSMTLDPDIGELREERFDATLEAHLHDVLEPIGVAWETRALAGDPARALTKLAEKLDAMIIVVGTRESGLRGTLHEFFSGSVAVHLAHRQHRPVLIVPLAPVGFEAALPWESAS